jgi:hypothetical protein
MIIKEDLVRTMQSIYEWPLKEDVIWDVYSNFLELALTKDEYVVEYLNKVVDFSSSERIEYRNKLAEQGFELRPDELSQYTVLIMIALKESIGV